MTDLLRSGRQEETVRIPRRLPLKAAIYLPTHLAERDLSIWRERCIAHCLAMGYDIQVVVTGGADAWDQLQNDLHADDIQVCVVGRREHLPPQRLPRVEETGTEPGGWAVAAAQHRTRPRRMRPARPHWDKRA